MGMVFERPCPRFLVPWPPRCVPLPPRMGFETDGEPRNAIEIKLLIVKCFYFQETYLLGLMIYHLLNLILTLNCLTAVSHGHQTDEIPWKYVKLRYKTMTENKELLRIHHFQFFCFSFQFFLNFKQFWIRSPSCKCSTFNGYICSEISLIVVLWRILGKLRLVNQVTQENTTKVASSTKIRLLRFRKNSESNFYQMLLSLKCFAALAPI